MPQALLDIGVVSDWGLWNPNTFRLQQPSHIWGCQAELLSIGVCFSFLGKTHRPHSKNTYSTDVNLVLQESFCFSTYTIYSVARRITVSAGIQQYLLGNKLILIIKRLDIMVSAGTQQYEALPHIDGKVYVLLHLGPLQLPQHKVLFISIDPGSMASSKPRVIRSQPTWIMRWDAGPPTTERIAQPQELTLEYSLSLGQHMHQLGYIPTKLLGQKDTVTINKGGCLFIIIYDYGIKMSPTRMVVPTGQYSESYLFQDA